jgi:ABC-type bacteriocin/lantibiotic exporter with double-glycine peptidase domain
LLGLKKGLAKVGLKSYGFELNLNDLPKVGLPAVLLYEGHYVALIGVRADTLRVYDPMTVSLRSLALPEARTAPATLLLFRNPKLG